MPFFLAENNNCTRTRDLRKNWRIIGVGEGIWKTSSRKLNLCTIIIQLKAWWYNNFALEQILLQVNMHLIIFRNNSSHTFKSYLLDFCFGGKTFNSTDCMEIKLAVANISIKRRKQNLGVSIHRHKPVIIIWELTLNREKDGDKWKALLSGAQITCRAAEENIFTIYQIVLFFEMLKPFVNHFWAHLFSFQTFSSLPAGEEL